MCRLSAFFGAPICAADLVTRPSRSIITQSFDARERIPGDASTPGYLNGDGFGLGWYSADTSDVTPCVYRQARPAWNDPNLGSIAEKVVTPVLFAHVRAASPGLDVSETTCHPFRFGRYLWMHNGGVGDFYHLRRNILPTLSEDAFDFAVSHGSSDTALCFAVFLSLIDDKMAQSSPEVLLNCVEKTVNILEKAVHDIGSTSTSLLNFVVSDGDSLVATRYVVSPDNPDAQAASLYYASGNSYQSDGSAPGNFAMMHTDRRPTLAIISSEPLTEKRSDWVSVPRNHSIVVTKSMHILLTPIKTTPDAVVSRILVNLSQFESGERLTSSRLSSKDKHNRQSTVKHLVEYPKPTEAKFQRRKTKEVATTPKSPHVVTSTICSTITLPGRTVLYCVTMGPYLCSGTDDGTIQVWDFDKDLLSEVLHSGQNAILAMLADEESGILICCSSASVVFIYRLSTKRRFELIKVISCDAKGDVLALTKIGHSVYAGFSDSQVRCIVKDLDSIEHDVPTECGANTTDTESSMIDMSACGFEFPSVNTTTHYGSVFAIASCLNGRFLCTGSGDGLLRVWNVENQECVQKRDDHAGAILSLISYEVSHGTMLFSGSRDCSVKVWVWDGESGFICRRTLRKHRDEVIFLARGGEKLISGSADGVVCVWCIETLALLCQYRDNSLKSGAVSMRHKLLFTASDEGAIQVRNIVATEKDMDQREHAKAAVSANKMYVSKAEKIGIRNTAQRSNDKETNGALNHSPAPVSSDEHDTNELRNGVNSCTINGSSGAPRDGIVSEIQEDSDEAQSLVPGMSDDMILAPPMSPMMGTLNTKRRSILLSNFLDDNGGSNGLLNDNEGTNMLGNKLNPGALLNGQQTADDYSRRIIEQRVMQDVLGRFLSFPTISGSDDHKEDCWQGARYLGNLLEGLGAHVKFVSPGSPRVLRPEDQNGVASQSLDCKSPGPVSGYNPIVLAKFASANAGANTITFYGHYDVMPVNASQWRTDPWALTSIDGYFYGRGATDNKGPILAMVFAIKQLLEERCDGLGINIVLVLEGEGEMGNRGFKECIESHLHWFENTSLILTSNSYWLGEEKPCITYGFRGVIDLQVKITGGSRNMHSGVDGGAVFEPVNDLITILSTMVDASGVVCIPGFYDEVRPLCDADRKLLQEVDFDINEYQVGTGVGRFTSKDSSELLEKRWRQPSISISSIETSNEKGIFSMVPNQATGKISIRFVPDQDPNKLEKAVRTHLAFELRKRHSPNTMSVTCMNSGDWWLDDPSSAHFQVAERAIRSVWGTDPEYVCEGGSMPVFSHLVKTLNAPLVQVPLGQSSDGAHLSNERIRSINFFRGKEVLQKIVREYAEEGDGRHVIQ